MSDLKEVKPMSIMEDVITKTEVVSERLFTLAARLENINHLLFGDDTRESSEATPVGAGFLIRVKDTLTTTMSTMDTMQESLSSLESRLK